MSEEKTPAVTEPQSTISLDADLMFFSAAVHAFHESEGVRQRMQKTADDYVEFMREARTLRLSAETIDRWKQAVTKSRSISEQISRIHGEAMQQFAVVHIMSAAALEAHINIVAKKHLKNREIQDFERMMLSAKWLFLPRLLKCNGFDAGAEPFQSFEKLISYRNNLLHYKAKSTLFNQDNFVDRLAPLGTSREAAQTSLGTVEKMVCELARQVGYDISPWKEGAFNFFRFRIEDAHGQTETPQEEAPS